MNYPEFTKEDVARFSGVPPEAITPEIMEKVEADMEHQCILLDMELFYWPALVKRSVDFALKN